MLARCGVTREFLYAPRTDAVPVANWAYSAPMTVSVATADAQAVQGYYWRGTPGDPDIFVFFHGRHFNADIAAKYAQYLLARGDAVLVASYRGFGPNKGAPSETRMMQDSAAFLGEARQLAGKDARLWLVGHSIGAGVALQAAAKDSRVEGVFVLSGFARVAEAAPRIARVFIPDRWDNRIALQSVHVPLLFFQGAQDTIIPAKSGRDLMATATGPARLYLGAEGKHSPDMTRLGPWMSAAIATMADGRLDRLDKLPAMPQGWTEQGRRP